MSSAARSALLVLLSGALAVSQAVAGGLPIRNGAVTARPASGSLAAEIERIEETAWIAYAVPVSGEGQSVCCTDRRHTRPAACSLARRGESLHHTSSTRWKGPGSDDLIVLLRVADRRVDRIRSFTADCALDAGSARVDVLQDIAPAESVAFLEGLVLAPAGRRAELSEAGLMAIALHRDEAADGALGRVVKSDLSTELRGTAAFWLGAARDARGVEILIPLLARESSAAMREKVVFALSLSDRPDAGRALVAAARRDSAGEVRSAALFWLGQMAGRRAADTLLEAVQDDPEIEVKRHAVFALSQLPTDEGVPLLIEIARTHRDPEIRETAMFWLGQSGDERALELFAEILEE